MSGQTLAGLRVVKWSRCQVRDWSCNIGEDRLLTCMLVLLQPMKEEPPLEARCKDKFLVQTVTIRADQEVGNVASIVRVT